MPSAYTSDLHDGTETSFEHFVLKCARVIDFLSPLRDDPLSAAIPVFEPDLYLLENLRRAQEQLVKAQWMSLTDAGAAAQQQAEETRKGNADLIKYGEERWARYEAMLQKVKAWVPPTPEHEGLKSFMIEQIQDSSRFSDPASFDRYRQPVVAESAEDYLANEVKMAKERVERCEKSWAEEQERVRARNQWVQELKSSLAK